MSLGDPVDFSGDIERAYRGDRLAQARLHIRELEARLNHLHQLIADGRALLPPPAMFFPRLCPNCGHVFQDPTLQSTQEND